MARIHQVEQRKVGLGVSIIALGLQFAFAADASAQTSKDPRVALQQAGYTTYSGDLEHDGDIDILVKAKARFVVIDLDSSDPVDPSQPPQQQPQTGGLIVPVPLKPSSPTFLLRASGGSYSLEVAPPASIVNDPVWVVGAFALTFGDVTGTGARTLLLRSTTAGSTSFLVTPSSTGQPQLLQVLTPAALGVDLGGAASEVTLDDKDSDGQADLVIRSNGAIVAVLIARDDGTFAKDTSSEGAPLMAWRIFCASLDDGNLDAALSYISTPSRSLYQGALVNLGTAITGLTSHWVGLKTVEVSSTYAIFNVTQNLGENLQYQIVMVQEDGQWRVDLF